MVLMIMGRKTAGLAHLCLCRHAPSDSFDEVGRWLSHVEEEKARLLSRQQQQERHVQWSPHVSPPRQHHASPQEHHLAMARGTVGRAHLMI